MTGDSIQPLACDLGTTGKLIRRALVTRSAPPVFREALRRQLVDRESSLPDAAAARLTGGTRYRPGGAANPRF